MPALAILGLAGPVGAQPKPTVLTMQWVQGDNIHLAGRGGAINRHRDVKIRVELRAASKVKVVDAGSLREHDLYESFSTDEESTWTNTWSGTWAVTGGTLELALVLDDRKCTKTKSSTGVAPQSLPCEPVSKQITLACTTERITLEANGRKTTHAAWDCTPETTAEFGDTPSDWLLGKTLCIRTNGGKGGASYQKCTP
jgi:hypothetical protein